eukprot:maker-scaffold_3-snap-gene-14.52-mRNA-1 protein AED:0.07 eAED:0.07 QI:0/0/0/1/0/0/2/0/620
MSLSSVREAAKKVLELTPDGLDVLINNSGIGSAPDRHTEDGLDYQMQVNHLSHFLLIHLLLPTLKVTSEKRGDVRIVQHSSAARNIGKGLKEKYLKKEKGKNLGGNGLFAKSERYHQTKLANTTFAMALHKKLQETKLKGLVKSVVGEPGDSNTDIIENMRDTHKKEGTYSWNVYFTLKLFEFIFSFRIFKVQSAADGSMPIIKCGFGKEEDVDGGDFFIPEEGTVGIPLKVISKAKDVLKGKERHTMSEDNQALVWSASERALEMKELYTNFLETIPSLEGKAVAITGTTSGTGYWAAVCAVRKNASQLLLLNRDSVRFDASIEQLENEKEKFCATTIIQPVSCDLMSLSSVREAAKKVLELTPDGLDVLINNAGIGSAPDRHTEDGLDYQMQVNHLGHFLLVHLLLPTLKVASEKRGDVRIVQHSSAARNIGKGLKAKYFKKGKEENLGGNGFFAVTERYHQTKLANTTFAMALHKKLQETKLKGLVKSVVGEPGDSNTDIIENMRDTHKKEGTYSWNVYFTLKLFEFIFSFRIFKVQSAADGSMPIIKCGFGKEEDVDGGDFFIPEEGTVGIPLKVISKAKDVLNGNEKNTMSEENQILVWTESEKALGIEFFSTLE